MIATGSGYSGPDRRAYDKTLCKYSVFENRIIVFKAIENAWPDIQTLYDGPERRSQQLFQHVWPNELYGIGCIAPVIPENNPYTDPTL